jgi:hypothetical protein
MNLLNPLFHWYLKFRHYLNYLLNLLYRWYLTFRLNQTFR